MSPTEALGQLMAGNTRFQSDHTHHPLLHSERREELVGGQAPFAVTLSCSDSSVPPEVIFDQGLGGLFVVRLAATRSPALISRASTTRSGTSART
jgi:carbonic anhydrase